MPTATVSAENIRGLTAIVARWDKGLAEPGGGARAKTGRRAERPSREPRPERLLRLSDPSSEAPDPTWPLRFLPEPQTTPLAEFWGCTSPCAER